MDSICYNGECGVMVAATAVGDAAGMWIRMDTFRAAITILGRCESFAFTE